MADFADATVPTPEDTHWRDVARWEEIVGAAPSQGVDRAELRRLLTSKPWALTPETAQWVVRAGSRFFRTPLPLIPETVYDALPP